MTIEELIERKEGQTFDCKSIQIEPKALAVTMVAMANADGGLLAIGISDKTRRIEGIDQSEERLNDILRVPFDFCHPSIAVSYSYLSCEDCHGKNNRVLLIEVPASSFLHTNQADEAYLRVGDKSRKLSFDERMQLLYDKGLRFFEDTAVNGATIEDIDMDAVKAYIKKAGYSKTAMEFLWENNGFVRTNKNGEEEVSTSCILLFGNYPQKFFPRARTRFIKYRGTVEKVGAEMNVIKDVTFEGTILNQIQKTVEYLETQVAEHSYLGKDGIFVTDREYPKFVIQEMTVNSCCHRDYSIKGTEIQIKMFDDRLVFETPGKFPGMVKAENIRHTHFSRNPKIAQFLKAYKYVKEFGEGIDRIFREQEANEADAPTFVMNEFILASTVRKSSKVTEDVGSDVTSLSPVMSPVVSPVQLTERQVKIYKLVKENPQISTSEMSPVLSVGIRTIKRDIIDMQKKGVVTREGNTSAGKWVLLMEI